MTNEPSQIDPSLTQGAAFVCLANRTLVAISGSDRKKFLHSFCTADIKHLETGKATEAFVLNDKGKILWHGLVLSLTDELLLTSHGQFADPLISHLDKYIIRDDVRLEDRTKDQIALFAYGSAAPTSLTKSIDNLPPANCVVEVPFGAARIVLANVEIAGFGFLILGPIESAAAIESMLESVNLVRSNNESLNRLRIEHRTPWLGIDIDDSNLPQELQRDEKAISFTKGCYLGQETVARIDAIGHVNKLLVPLSLMAQREPDAGSGLMDEGKSVGRLTSVATTANGQYIGLGYVRRAKSKPGTELNLDSGTATVLDN